MRKVTSSWRAPFSARNRASAFSVLTALDGGVAKGVQGSWVLVRFNGPRLTQLLDRPPLPCTPWPSCKPTRPRRLKQLYEGSSDPGLMQELRTSDGPCPLGNESHSAVPWSDDVHSGGPGMPPMAGPGRYE